MWAVSFYSKRGKSMTEAKPDLRGLTEDELADAKAALAALELLWPDEDGKPLMLNVTVSGERDDAGNRRIAVVSAVVPEYNLPSATDDGKPTRARGPKVRADGSVRAPTAGARSGR